MIASIRFTRAIFGIRADSRIIMSKRVEWIDAARSLAIVCVMLCHASETVFGYDTTGVPAFAVLRSIGRLGVPLFLCITGALILAKDFTDTKSIGLFYKKNLLPLLVTSEIWILIYSLFIMITGEYMPTDGISGTSLIEWMLFLKPFPLSHWWYIPTIIGLYIALPFVSLVLHHINCTKVILIPIAVVFIYRYFAPTLNDTAIRFNLPYSFSSQIDTTWLGGVYGLYTVIGYYIARKKVLSSLPSFVILLLFTASFALSVWSEYFNVESWYDTPWILFASICLFESLKRAGDRGCFTAISKPLEKISRNSFGIYLLHKPMIITVANCFFFIHSSTLKACVVALVIFALSLLIVSAFSRWQKLQRILFHA